MPIIDPSSNLGKCRLRCGDTSDMPFLSDLVYTQVLSDTNNNLQLATKTCASYILATLAFNSHEKLYQIEIWGSEAFENYSKYLQQIVLNPSFSDQAMIPYGSSSDNTTHPLIQFISDWNNCYITGTQSELLHEQATGYTYGLSQSI